MKFATKSVSSLNKTPINNTQDISGTQKYKRCYVQQWML